MFGVNAGVQLQNIANLKAQMTAYAAYLKAASEELKTIYAELIQALKQDVEKLEIEKKALIERVLLH